jgi:hypothetical protein
MNRHFVNAELEMNRARFLIDHFDKKETLDLCGLTQEQAKKRIQQYADAAIKDLQKFRAEL